MTRQQHIAKLATTAPSIDSGMCGHGRFWLASGERNLYPTTALGGKRRIR